jgi:hypothetical protein
LGADVNSQGSCGNTALHNAAFHGHFHIVRALRKAGADIAIENSEGMIPLDMTDHMDIYKQPTQAMRAFLSPAMAAKHDYVKKLRKVEAMNWIDRDQPTSRLQAKIKKKYHWTDRPDPVKTFGRKRAYDKAQADYLAGSGYKPPAVLLHED